MKRWWSAVKLVSSDRFFCHYWPSGCLLVKYHVIIPRFSFERYHMSGEHEHMVGCSFDLLWNTCLSSRKLCPQNWLDGVRVMPWKTSKFSIIGLPTILGYSVIIDEANARKIGWLISLFPGKRAEFFFIKLWIILEYDIIIDEANFRKINDWSQYSW